MELTRTLEFVPTPGEPAREIVVTIGEPEPDPEPGGDFRCRLVISGFEKPYDHHFHGVDPIQALINAVWIVPDAVGMLSGRKGRVTWLGTEGLGFRYGDRLSKESEDEKVTGA